MTKEDFYGRFQFDPEKDKIGKGGFSQVFKAYDRKLQTTVALKFFTDELQDKYSLAGEVKRASQYEHPNLIRYQDSFVFDSENSLGMKTKTRVASLEFANSGEFFDFLKRFPSEETIKEVIRQILEGLLYLQKKQVVHRDMKPQNILMHHENGKWVPKISDFGISKHLGEDSGSASVTIGTLEYMAPEQFHPNKYGIKGVIAPNVDLWALGVILYQVFTGAAPFGSVTEGQTRGQVMNKILSGEVPHNIRQVPEPFRSMILRCLEKNANHRAVDCQELLDHLDGKLPPVSLPVPTVKATPPRPPVTPIKKSRPKPDPNGGKIKVAFCKKCKRSNIPKAKKCVYCASPLKPKDPKNRILAGEVLLVLLFPFAGFILWVANLDNRTQKAWEAFFIGGIKFIIALPFLIQALSY